MMGRMAANPRAGQLAQPEDLIDVAQVVTAYYTREPDPENVAHIVRFSASLGNVERVDVLPFHQMGRFKWKELKLNYTLNDVQPPSAEAMERACEQFRLEGLTSF